MNTFYSCMKCQGTFSPDHTCCPLCDRVTVEHTEQLRIFNEDRTRILSLEAELRAAKGDAVAGVPTDFGLSEVVFDGQHARIRIEQKLLPIYGDALDRTTYDSYDNSIEIYLDSAAPFAITQEHIEAIAAFGFSRMWVNFPDGTEVYAIADGGQRYVGPRKQSAKRPAALTAAPQSAQTRGEEPKQFGHSTEPFSPTGTNTE